MSTDQLERIGEALRILINAFGAGWTATIILGALAMVLLFRMWSQKRVDRGFKAALDEKERTIQRLASEARTMRVLLFQKQFKISRQQAEKLIERNEFATAEEARTVLETRDREERRAAKKRKRGR